MTAITEEATYLSNNPNWALLQTAVDYNTRLVEFAFINVGSAFEYARKLLSVKSASEFVEVVVDHTREQLEALSEQVEELSALVEKVSHRNGEDTELSFGD